VRPLLLWQDKEEDNTMARMVSWNYHLEIDEGVTIQPKTLSEFGEGDEGRVEAADGTRKYKVRDNIWDIGEIEVEIYLRDDWSSPESEFMRMEQWCNNNQIKDIYIIGTDITGGDNEKIVWHCAECELAKGKKNAFDRNGKEVDCVKYYILPQYVELVGTGEPAPSATGIDFYPSGYRV